MSGRVRHFSPEHWNPPLRYYLKVCVFNGLKVKVCPSPPPPGTLKCSPWNLRNRPVKKCLNSVLNSTLTTSSGCNDVTERFKIDTKL